MKKKFAALLMSAVLLMSVLAGCGGSAGEPGEQEEQIGNVDSAGEENQTTANLNICTVTTPFGDLYYQEQWSEFMRPEIEQSQEACKVSFRAELNGKLYPLFVVTIGEAEGDPVRQLTDAQGTKRNVYVEVEEFLDVSGLDEGNERLLYAMQEDINFIIENIK